MTDLSQFSGSAYAYNDRTIPLFCEEWAIAQYAKSTKRAFAPLMKSMDDIAFTQWITRNYISLKLIMASTVLANTAIRCEEQHLMVTLPYLNYYSMLNACRAFLFTLHDAEWKGLTSVTMTHQNIVNTTANALWRIDPHADSLSAQVLRISVRIGSLPRGNV